MDRNSAMVPLPPNQDISMSSTNKCALETTQQERYQIASHKQGII